jgi:rhamnose utilization protein RhaD (predicted bifunctional aldolase and dehydrogenase)
MDKNTALYELAAISREYGKDPDYVLAGGGNTSVKVGGELFVKASGFALADIDESGFCAMSLEAMDKIWEKSYPADPAEREAAVLADMMAARSPGETKRPSVEALLHAFLPFPWVIHLHPALVNGLTCSQDGEQAMKRLFGDKALWVPITNPGYILAEKVKEAGAVYKKAVGREADIIFLQNHGVFVSSGTPGGIRKLYKYIMTTLDAEVKRRPDFGNEADSWDGLNAVKDTLAEAYTVNSDVLQPSFSPCAFAHTDDETRRRLASSEAFLPVSSAFTPDHIVYSGSNPLFIEDEASAQADFATNVASTGRIPKIAAVKGKGIIGLGQTEKAARLALLLFKDMLKIACYAESFGGYRFMEKEYIDFINGWEVESYRSKLSGR